MICDAGFALKLLPGNFRSMETGTARLSQIILQKAG